MKLSSSPDRKSIIGVKQLYTNVTYPCPLSEDGDCGFFFFRDREYTYGKAFVK
jgi:hypothetical protein